MELGKCCNDVRRPDALHRDADLRPRSGVQGKNSSSTGSDTADAEIAVNGNARNLAKAWKLESLPPKILARLSALAERTGYPNVSALLTQPFDRYQSNLPLAQIAPKALAKAAQTSAGDERSLSTSERPDNSSYRMVERGLAAYERFFGYRISDRSARTCSVVSFREAMARKNGRGWSCTWKKIRRGSQNVTGRQSLANGGRSTRRCPQGHSRCYMLRRTAKGLYLD